MKDTLTKFSIFLFSISFILILYCAIMGFYNTREAKYCGKVLELYITDAGHKVSSERHIVFYNDSLKRNIDVRVTNQTYVNIKEGETVCFDLNRIQLEE